MKLFKISPLADRAFKQVLPIVQQLYAGGGRQGVYPAPHYGILVDGPVQEGVQTAGDAGSIWSRGCRILSANQDSHVTSRRNTSKTES